jgi:predicted unusual protein kinase regulating ubiquinone biosynthesis (AarF/ABC1/UbiB family)
VLECVTTSNRLTFPGDLALLFRVLVRLQGVGGALGARVSLTELLQRYLRKMAADRLNPRTIGPRAVRSLRGWQRVLADAPELSSRCPGRQAIIERRIQACGPVRVLI